MNELCIYIALYCVLLHTQSALQSWGGDNHHQCSILLDDATATTGQRHQCPLHANMVVIKHHCVYQCPMIMLPCFCPYYYCLIKFHVIKLPCCYHHSATTVFLLWLMGCFLNIKPHVLISNVQYDLWERSVFPLFLSLPSLPTSKLSKQWFSGWIIF